MIRKGRVLNINYPEPGRGGCCAWVLGRVAIPVGTIAVDSIS